MASSVWTNAKVEQFIEILETKECLYNITLKEYHNRENPRNAIQEIATALKATGTLYGSDTVRHCHRVVLFYRAIAGIIEYRLGLCISRPVGGGGRGGGGGGG